MTTDYAALRKALKDVTDREISCLRAENEALRAQVLNCNCQPLGEYPPLPPRTTAAAPPDGGG